MKYNSIEMRRHHQCQPNDIRWTVVFDNTDVHNRISSKKYIPNSGLGFFYYPRKWCVEKAFDMLKQSMIERREAEIKFWQREIEELKRVELPEWCIESDKKK